MFLAWATGWMLVPVTVSENRGGEVVSWGKIIVANGFFNSQ